MSSLSREEVKNIFSEEEIKKVLEKKYGEDNLSTNQISDWFKEEYDLNVSHNVVYLFLKEFNIQVRNQSDSISLTARQLDYNTPILEKDPECLEVLDGLLISDGTISKTKSRYHRFSLSSVQEEFVNYARSYFKNFMPSEVSSNNSKPRNRGYEKTKYSFSTSCHPDITKQRIRWYKNDFKRVPKDIRITPIMLKMWYYGDGSLITKRGKSNTCVIRLSTDGFLKEDVDFLVEQLNEQVGIESVNSENRIRLKSKSIKRFFNFIGRNSDLTCYSYKFDVDDWRFLTPLKEAANILNIKYNRLSHLVGLKCIEFERSPGGKKVGFTDLQLEKLKSLHKNGLLTSDPRKNSSSITKNSFKKVPVNLKSKISLIRNSGFPYINLSEAERTIIFNRLNNVPSLSINGRDINASYRDNELAMNFHPHMFHVKCSNFLSPYETFCDESSLSKIIENRENKNSELSNSNIRYDLCRFKKTKRTSLFPVRVAKTLYTEYGKDGMKVLDPCSGYSSRLLGFYSCARGGEYIGTDPCLKTFNGLNKTVDEIEPMTKNHKAKIYNEPAEKLIKDLSQDDFDLIFTSPPYFNLEKYSQEKTQSYLKYPKYEDWLENFLFEIIRESYRVLKSDGYFLLNVANCGKKEIVQHVDLFVKKMFRVENVLLMNSPSMFAESTTEPIFVLRKN